MALRADSASPVEPQARQPTEDTSVPSRVPGLPPLPLGGPFAWARGPHDTCNFVLPGRLLAGSYPGGRYEPEHTEKIGALIEAGVDTFVCLQQTKELARFTPYPQIARRLAEQQAPSRLPLQMLQCEIPDGHVTSTENLTVAVAAVAEKLQEGRTVYVHCWGGHGRTGTLLVAFLVKVYGITTEQAKQYFMETHSQRRVRGGGGPGHWPHSQAQFRQAQSFEGQEPELSGAGLPELGDWEKSR